MQQYMPQDVAGTQNAASGTGAPGASETDEPNAGSGQ
jgi:hypothetical protein